MKRAMVKAVREKILIADSSKWAMPSVRAKVVGLEAFLTVNTDGGLDDVAPKTIEEKGINLIVT